MPTISEKQADDEETEFDLDTPQKIIEADDIILPIK